MSEYRELATDALDLLGLLLLAWGIGWVLYSLWAPLGPIGAAVVIFAGVQAIGWFARKREETLRRELVEDRRAARVGRAS